MNLGFYTKFPWGEPTFFYERIIHDGGFIGPFDEWPDKEPFNKIHTLRRNERWKGGMSIQMATGIRSKNYKRINKYQFTTCTGVQSIEIKRSYGAPTPDIWIDGIKVEKSAHESIAMNDGFPSLQKFYRFFSKGFKGQIIHWTEFRYTFSEYSKKEKEDETGHS